MGWQYKEGEKSSSKQGTCVVSRELRGVTVHWGFDGWAGGESWLRIWGLFGLPIVPGLLMLFIENSTLPVLCTVISPSITEAKAAQWFHWRFMITEGLMVDQRATVLCTTLCMSVSVWVDCSVFQAFLFESQLVCPISLFIFKTHNKISWNYWDHSI